MTPPPFSYLGVPDEVQEETNRHGPGIHTWDLLAEAGVDTLYWRQPLKHIEVNFWSEDVYSSMKGLMGDQLSFENSFSFSNPRGPTRRYYQFRIEPWPGRRFTDDGVRATDWIVPELCEPPLAPDSLLKGPRKALRNLKDQRVELAIPSWLNRGSGSSFSVNASQLVTGEFVERWRSTEISKYLREQNWEHDIDFVPSNVGFAADRNIDYRWVDVPVPDGVEN